MAFGDRFYACPQRLVSNVVKWSQTVFIYEIISSVIQNEITKFKYIIGQLGSPYSEKLWPRAAFWGPRSQFNAIKTDAKPANNVLIFYCGKLAYKWVCLHKMISQ